MKNNVIIFGDSYSTFKGFIPDGYAVYYSEEERPETDVTKVSETWWHQVVNEANLNLVLNNSWSGSTIGYTGYNNSDCSKSSSFIYRLKELIENGFFTNPDATKLILRILVTSIWNTVVEIEFEGLWEWQILNDTYFYEILDTSVSFNDKGYIVWADDVWNNREELEGCSFAIAKSMKWRIVE